MRVRSVATCVLIIAAGLAASGSGAGAAEWPEWRGVNRDGKSPDTGLLKEWPQGGPPLLWKASGIGNGFSSVAVTGNTVYITGVVGGNLALSALDARGNPQWQKSIGPAYSSSHAGARATPTVNDGKIYVMTGKGRLGCVDARNGNGLWAVEMSSFGGKPGSWGYAESPLVVGNIVVAKPGGEHCIVALNKADGKPVWTSSGFNAGPEYSSCYLFSHAGVPMIATGTRNGIACVAPQNGQMLWSNNFAAGNTANCPTPLYSDGYVYWANGYGKGGICLKLSGSGSGVTAQEAWRTRDMDCHHGGYIIHDGHIYGNNGGGWACIELASGQTKWKERAVGKGSLCFADGMLYLFSESGGKGALATCSPSGLEIKGNVTVQGSGPSWAHPVVIGSCLFLRYDDNLYCFNVKAG